MVACPVGNADDEAGFGGLSLSSGSVEGSEESVGLAGEISGTGDASIVEPRALASIERSIG